jgi:hypothetical protein
MTLNCIVLWLYVCVASMTLRIPTGSWGVPRIRCFSANIQAGLYPIGSEYRTDGAHNTASQGKILPCLAANNKWKQSPVLFDEEVKQEEFRPEVVKHLTAWCWVCHNPWNMTSNQSHRGPRWNLKFAKGAEQLTYLSMHISSKIFKQQCKSWMRKSIRD